MRRRTRLVLAVSLIAAVVGAAALVGFRAVLVESLLTAGLAAQGVSAPRLAVADVGWRTSRIVDVRLGDADEVSLHELRLDYGLGGLLAGRLDRVTATGLAIALDLTGAGPVLGSLQPLLSRGRPGDRDAAAGAIPNMEIADLRVTARTALGLLTAIGSGRLAGGDDGGTTAELSLADMSLDGQPLAAGRIGLGLASDRMQANLALDAPAGDFAIDGTVTIENPKEAPRWRLDMAARVAADSAVWAAWPGPAPTAGRAEVTLRGEGAAPPLSELIAADDWLRRLLAEEAVGSISVSAADVTVPAYVEGARVGAQLTVEARDGVASVALPETANLTATSVSPVWLEHVGLAGEIAALAAHGFAAGVQPMDGQHPLATIAREDDGLAVAIDGILHVAVPDAVDLSLALPADVRVAPERLTARLRSPADMHLTALRHDRIGELLAPVAIAIPQAEVDIGPETAGGREIGYRVQADVPAMRLRLRGHGATGIDATVRPGRIGASPGQVAIGSAGIDLPAYGIAADGLDARIAMTGAEVGADFRVAALRQTGARPLLAPLALAGTVSGQGLLWRASLTGNGPGGVGRIQTVATFDSTAGQGSAHLVLAPLAFAPGGAQPGSLLPALATLQRVTGSADGEAHLTWSARGVRGSGTLALRDIGFDSPQARIEGLDLHLQLDSLVPPGSPPGQTLSVRRLEPGLPLDRLAIRFQVQPAEPPRLAIETGEVFFGSGRLALSNFVIDPAATGQHLELLVQDLSLAELFALLGIDGLGGEGQLSGVIPMTFSGGTVVIEKGRLAAGAPGIIRFRSEQAAQILAGQGESLDLVRRALEDFHYDELTVDLDKSAADVGRMKLSMLGKNPAVLDGYPFRFNISIEANPSKLAAALTTIYRVPDDLLRRAWTSGR